MQHHNLWPVALWDLPPPFLSYDERFSQQWRIFHLRRPKSYSENQASDRTKIFLCRCSITFPKLDTQLSKISFQAIPDTTMEAWFTNSSRFWVSKGAADNGSFSSSVLKPWLQVLSLKKPCNLQSALPIITKCKQHTVYHKLRSWFKTADGGWWFLSLGPLIQHPLSFRTFLK